MKHLFFILFFALTFTASGQTITTFNYTYNGKVKARTTIIKVQGNTVYINKKPVQRLLKFKATQYT